MGLEKGSLLATSFIVTAVLLFKIKASSAAITCSSTTEDSGIITCFGQCYASIETTTHGQLKFKQDCYFLLDFDLNFCGQCDPNNKIYCCNTSYCNTINASSSPTTFEAFEVFFPCSISTIHSLPTADAAATGISTAATGAESNFTTTNTPLAMGLVVIPLSITLLPLAVVLCRRKRFRKWLMKTVVRRPPTTPDVLATCPVENLTSGRYGGPRLMEKTIAHDISVKEAIGLGRHGRVYRGEYLRESVAVKKFINVSEDIGNSWARECELYNSVSLRHDNILVFITNDIVSRNDGLTELWLVTQYHSLGSLHDYLQLEKLSLTTALKMTTSISKGLAYLHTSLCGVFKKPEIAHRDIKSRNILVKDNLECCLADFGLAVGWNSAIKFVVAAQQGTKRYMAPEILDGRINIKEMESFLCADVYSFGLVLWEVFSRCQLGDCCLEEYRLPYDGLVPPDPSVEDMYRVVVKEQKRPPFPPHWQENKPLQDLMFIMSECWYHDPDARPNMVSIKVKLLHFSA